MFIRTDDPLADFDQYEYEKQRWLKKYPKCTSCTQHIQQPNAVCIDGKYFCDECLEDLREVIGDD